MRNRTKLTPAMLYTGCLMLLALVVLGLQAAPAISQDVDNGRDQGGDKPVEPSGPSAAPSTADPASESASSGTELHDNGPLVNCPGCGAGGADVSAVQAQDLGMGTFGFAHDASEEQWVADNFKVRDEEGWSITDFTFFAYQTGSETESTLTGLRWILFDGDPSSTGQEIAAGGGLASSEWANIYRTNDGDLKSTARPVMRSQAAAPGIYLPEGEYWLAWQTAGTLISGLWAPPITIAGQAETGDGLQMINDSWNPALDAGSGARQGLPFIIRGAAGRTLQCNAPAVTFDEGIPGDWTPVSPYGPVHWTLTTDKEGCNQDYEAGGSSPGACADADTTNQAGEVYGARLWTNAFDLSQATGATLKLRYRFNQANNSFFSIQAGAGHNSGLSNLFLTSVDNPGGAAGDSLTLDMSDFAGKEDVVVRFRYEGQQWDNYVQIDNVALSCALKPNVSVEPLFISSAQAAGRQMKLNVELGNDGTEALDWFIFENQGSSCLQQDLPWLSVAPGSGQTPGGESDNVEVILDSTGLAEGTYNGRLCVFSNDPDPGPGNGTDLVTIPVELTVDNTILEKVFMPMIRGGN